MSTESLIGSAHESTQGAQPHWFIYYRLQDKQLAGALAVVRSMQQQLKARYPALQTRVMRRPGSPDGRVTLMETYTLDAACPSTLEQAALAALVLADIERTAALALQGWLLGERHVETFLPCA
jgi:hypothetical protein